MIRQGSFNFAEDAVKVMTMHRSKGLQFEGVVVNLDHWPYKGHADDGDVLDGEKGNIQDYLLESANFERRGDDRLLISQMLPQPFDNIPQLDGLPWDFVAASSLRDAREKERETVNLEELQWELYGDD